MGKLVLFLADGTMLDVPLERERVTIGRRADNDVCLPYPAVSGEHAAVVTILADSFLEDLGSTNGTLVNGKPVTKHFLRDRDQIDIGRQRMTYVADNAAVVEPLAPDALRQQIRGLTDLVTPAHPAPTVSVGAERRAPKVSAASAPLLADLERHMAGDAGPPAVPAPAVDASSTPPARAGDQASPESSRGGAVVATEDTALAEAPKAAAVAETPAGPMVRVLSGPNQGRSVPMHKDEMSLGRVGVQVALIRKVSGGFRLVPVEGTDAPRINGAGVPPEGAAQHPGDTFEVAGVRLELSVSA